MKFFVLASLLATAAAFGETSFGNKASNELIHHLILQYQPAIFKRIP
jgi:hypothetical protein